MQAELRAQVMKLLAAVLDLQPEERASFLAGAGVDEAVRSEVSSLLAYESGADSFLAAAVGQAAASALGSIRDAREFSGAARFMPAERLALIEEFFQRAMECAPDGRSRLLDEAGSTDPELRRDVASLLLRQPSAEERLLAAINAALPRWAEFRGTERFVVQRRLGQGGFGVVYQVYDRQQDAVVALKALPKTDAAAIYSFKREFRGLANTVHRNLVRLYELLSDGQQWFFTMELVDGVDFIRYVSNDDRHKRQSGLPFDEDRLRCALKQLAEGVCALHQAGRLHRDLKPSNVLVTKDGRVVILDFGLTTEIAANVPSDSEGIIGTPAYMSPEQAAGKPLSEASDWYSVGAMLYRSLTANLPIVAVRTREILARKRDADIPPPSALTVGIPKDLDLLCCDLLRRDPGERPAGRAVLDHLGGRAASDAPSRVTSEIPFIGREQELAELRQAFEIVGEGRAAIAYVHGGSGTGKSALVGRFLQELRNSDVAVVLAGRCYERESVPYKALDSLVDALTQYLMTLPRSLLDACVPRNISALTRLFPVLERVQSFARPNERGDATPNLNELRKHAFAAFRELVSLLSRWKPLVLFIDDLQWGDLDSAVLLADLLRPPEPPPVLWIGCYRTEEATTNPMLRTLLPSHSALSPAVHITELALKELTSLEARDLALRLLPEGQESAARAEAIAREAGGSPFFIGELARSMDESSGGLTLSLKNVIRARVSRLPETARLFLELVVVAGQPVALEAVKRAADIHCEEESVVGILRAAYLVRTRAREDINEIEAYHDRTREAVGESLRPEVLRARHFALACELESSRRADPETLLTHFQGAGEQGKAAQYAVTAGDRASAALAFDRAARLYRTALDLGPTGSAQTSHLWEKLGDALTNAGRGGQAAEAYLAATTTMTGLEKLELQRRAAAQLMLSGRVDEGLDVARGVLDALGVSLAKTAHRSVLRFLFWRARIWLRGLKFQARDACRIPSEERLRIDTCFSIYQGLLLVDTFWAQEFHARNLLYSLEAGDLYRIARALVGEAVVYASWGTSNRRRADQFLETATMLAERSANPHAVALAVMGFGFIANLRGEWKHARQQLDYAEALLRRDCTGVAWEIATAQSGTTMALYFVGELKLLAERFPPLLEGADGRGDLYQGTDFRGRIAHVVHLAADQPERATEELDRAMARWPRRHYCFQHWWAMLARLKIDFYCGRGRSAWEYISREWGPLRRSLLMHGQYVKILTLYYRGSAALLFAQDTRVEIPERKGLTVSAERDAVALAHEKMPWGRGFALLVRAGVASQRGNTQEAARLLVAAEATLESADMTLYAAAARRRRGELTAGDEGQVLIAQADKVMARQEIKNPARMAAMLAPGVSLPVSGSLLRQHQQGTI